MLNYSKRFSHVLLGGDGFVLVSESVRKMAMAALSNLSKFLGFRLMEKAEIPQLRVFMDFCIKRFEV